MTRREAEKVATVIQWLLDAWSELSAEHSGKRAAKWSVVNEGLYRGERMLAGLRRDLDAAKAAVAQALDEHRSIKLENV